MSLFRRRKRFKLSRLSVCTIYIADNLRYQSYGMAGYYNSLWTERFLGIKILIGDEIRKDPIHECEYVCRIDSIHPEKTRYYRDYGNIKEYFDFGKKTKISLDEIEELNSKLNSILNEEYNSSK